LQIDRRQQGPAIGQAVFNLTDKSALLTLPLVIYGIFRYQLLSDPEEIGRRNSGEDQGGETERPEEILLHDFPILCTVLSWVITCFVILLLEHQGIIS
ncbi:MAG: hypothetical protein AAGF26_17915, partial [Cyanobacteria bacterium P01_G01_bin.49]